MSFLIVLSCLMIQRFLGSFFWSTDRALFAMYRRYWSGCAKYLPTFGFFMQPMLRLVLFVLPLWLLVVACGYVAHALLGPFGYFLWSLFCLWVCLDAYDPSWRRSGEDDLDSDVSVAATKAGTAGFVFQHAFLRIFVLLFCFAVAGPVLVVIYRALYLLILEKTEKLEQLRMQPATVGIAGDLLSVVDWIPSRLLGLSYAIVGQFAPTMRLWWQMWAKPSQSGPLLTARWGEAALDDGAQDGCADGMLTQVKAMIDRCLVLWLVGFSVITLIRA